MPNKREIARHIAREAKPMLEYQKLSKFYQDLGCNMLLDWEDYTFGSMTKKHIPFQCLNGHDVIDNLTKTQVSIRCKAGRKACKYCDCNKPNEHPKITGSFCKKCAAERVTTTTMEHFDGCKRASQHPDIRKKIEDGWEEKYGDRQVLRVPEIREKGRQKNIENLGVPIPIQSAIVRDKMQNTFEKRTGHRFSAQNPESRSKMCATNQARYSVDNVFAAECFKQKIRERHMENLGVPYPMMAASCMAKSRVTNQERYGADRPLQNPDIYEKHVSTVLERYGEDNVSKVPEIQAKKVISSFRRKEHLLPSGTIVMCQGYEPYAIDELLKTHAEDDLKFHTDIPTIRYYNPHINRSNTVYLPDIYIESTQLLVEVKSTWTFKRDWIIYETNILKFRACVNAGYDVLLMMYDNKLNLDKFFFNSQESIDEFVDSVKDVIYDTTIVIPEDIQDCDLDLEDEDQDEPDF